VSGRRRFGAVRKLPSGRWQVRFRDPETERYRTAAQTFATKTEAGRWLSGLEADTTRGHRHDPRRGEVTFGEIAERWYATNANTRMGPNRVAKTYKVLRAVYDGRSAGIHGGPASSGASRCTIVQNRS
jgi:hypothetical protein